STFCTFLRLDGERKLAIRNRTMSKTLINRASSSRYDFKVPEQFNNKNAWNEQAPDLQCNR
ncbi:hypothetical protein L9F63_006820, partial [Diploptera punctata]